MTKRREKPLPQPSEPTDIAPIVEHHERAIAEARSRGHVDRAADAYRPTRGTLDAPRHSASSILRAVDKGGAIQLTTLTELLTLFETKTDYHVHVEIAILPSGSAILKTIDNERDAQETLRRLRLKP